MKDFVDFGKSDFSLTLPKQSDSSKKSSFWDVMNLMSDSGRKKFRREYWISHWNDIANQYGLTKDDLSLILPMLDGGASDEDIYSYIQSLNASHQTDENNSVKSQIADLRAAGYNPDLSGTLPSSGESSIPSSPFSIDDLPSHGGKGSLSEKFSNVAGLVLKTMSFGLQAYGLVSNSLISTASLLSGFADADALNVLADESGVVQDVNGAIDSLVKARGLKGRKAKQYASFLSSRINSAVSITGRLRQSSDKSIALADSRINGFKATDEYTNEVISFLKDTATKQAKMASYDLKIQEIKDQFLIDHPSWTAEELELAFRGKVADTKKAEAEALQAQNEAGISGERLKQERDNTDVVKSENEVKKLKSDIQKIELDALDEMIEFCKSFEDENKDLPKYVWWSMPNYEKYKNYKRRLNDYYYHSKNGNGKASFNVPGIGSVGVNF